MVYSPAIGSDDDYNIFFSDKTEILKSRGQNSTTIICGDYNGYMLEKECIQATHDVDVQAT